MVLLQLENISRRFGDVVAVADVSFDIEAGEFFTLLGPSGCGKTTLLRMIAGFEAADSGSMLLDGRQLAGIAPERRPIHTVFQSYALFPHMTVTGNVSFPLEMAAVPRQEIRRRVAEALASVHLTDKASAYPRQLSGGQQQRVALARALINRPRLLLLDESLAALDSKLREEMQLELINLQRQLGISFVFVTHAQQEALALSQRVAVMNQGRIEQIDAPSRLYGYPKNRFVADFVGKINLLAAQVLEAGPGHLRLSAPGLGEITAPAHGGSLHQGEQGVLGLRPEQLRLYGRLEAAELKNRFPGHIRESLYLGDVTLYKVGLGNGAVVDALLTNAAPERIRLHQAGDEVAVCWRHDAGVFLHD